MRRFIEDTSKFRMVLTVCSLLAIMFQAIGFSTNAWIRKSNGKQEYSIGLWKTNICWKLEETGECRTSKPKHKTILNDLILREVRLAASLATIAGVAAVFGLCSIVFMYFGDMFCKIRTRRLITCVFWITSAIFLLSAIICPSQFNYFLSVDCSISDEECDVLFPWSIFMSGIGLLLTTGCAVMIGLMMCFQPPKRRMPSSNII